MHKWRLLLHIFICLVASVGGLVSPYIIGDFIDQLMQAEDISFIYRYFVLFASISLGALLMEYVGGRLYIRLQTRLGYALNISIIRRLHRAPLRFTNRQDTAYLNQRINNDSNTLIGFCINIIQSILVNIVIISVASALMTFFHPPLAGVLLGLSAVYFIFYTLYKKVLYNANLEFKEAQAGFFSKLHEQLFNVRFIKLHSLFNHFISRLDHSFNRLLGSALRQQRATYIFGGMDKLVMMVAQMTLLIFGGMEIIAGRLTIGRFVIMSSYFGMMLGAIRYFFNLGKTIQNNKVSYDRLQELAQIVQEPNGTLLPETVENIEMQEVSFAYNGNDVIKNMNLSFKRGQIYVIAGANGAGKSTLADILLGLQTGEYNGQVRYNGILMEELDMYTMRNSLMAISEQEPILLTDSLAYNLNLDDENRVSNQQTVLKNLIDILGLEDFLQTLPEGYDSDSCLFLRPINPCKTQEQPNFFDYWAGGTATSYKLNKPPPRPSAEMKGNQKTKHSPFHGLYIYWY